MSGRLKTVILFQSPWAKLSHSKRDILISGNFPDITIETVHFIFVSISLYLDDSGVNFKSIDQLPTEKSFDTIIDEREFVIEYLTKFQVIKIPYFVLLDCMGNTIFNQYLADQKVEVMDPVTSFDMGIECYNKFDFINSLIYFENVHPSSQKKRDALFNAASILHMAGLPSLAMVCNCFSSFRYYLRVVFKMVFRQY